jgi:hypothetical protein
MDSAPFRDIVLDRIEYRGNAEVSEELLHSAQFSSYMDDIRHRLVVGLKAEVLSHKIADSRYTMTIPVPASPFQHWKHKHQRNRLVARFIKRNPVRYNQRSGTVTLSKAHRFPESTIRYPDSLGKLVVAEEAEVSYPINGMGQPSPLVTPHQGE